ncbi:hypothetical protein Pan153_41820 [Gimesia panareensis]|uniref:Uncharacterized protein n=1 Tax=Gimesia panareensis TaxID=2527978 RepID=A0A518FT39_9PLAN|nr:hypothetical protein Pan153_41820 [Gimesia panareensis]
MISHKESPSKERSELSGPREMFFGGHIVWFGFNGIPMHSQKWSAAYDI